MRVGLAVLALMAACGGEPNEDMRPLRAQDDQLTLGEFCAAESAVICARFEECGFLPLPWPGTCEQVLYDGCCGAPYILGVQQPSRCDLPSAFTLDEMATCFEVYDTYDCRRLGEGVTPEECP